MNCKQKKALGQKNHMGLLMDELRAIQKSVWYSGSRQNFWLHYLFPCKMTTMVYTTHQKSWKNFTQNKAPQVFVSYFVSIICFITASKLTHDSHPTCNENAMWVIHKFVSDHVTTLMNYRVMLNKKSPEIFTVPQFGNFQVPKICLKYFLEMNIYFLKRCANEKAVVWTNAEIKHFWPPAGKE